MSSQQSTIGAPIAKRRQTIAVIDDDLAVCNSLKFSLELEGFSVRTCASGAEMLQAPDVGSYDCFVVDQRMPQMSGLDLIDALRRKGIYTPAILIISNASMALTSRAAKAAVPIVEKPLLGDTLTRRIREACGLA
jgi:FixJ family two-component response regulator